MLPLLLLWTIITAASAVFLVLFLVVDEWQVRPRKAATEVGKDVGAAQAA